MPPSCKAGGITIYHGDCREILSQINADVLITDPPYGVEFDGKCTKHTTRSDSGYISGDDGEVGPAVIRQCLDQVNRAFVFPGTRQLFHYPEPRDMGCVYCPSGAGVGRWGWVCFHPVLLYGERPTPALYPSSIVSFDTAGTNGHPCPKPLRWMKWAVQFAALAGETILDPFCGSGPTLMAAKE